MNEHLHKPTGLWSSVDGDWERLCRLPNYAHWLIGRTCYEVVLGDEKILRLSTIAEVLAFGVKYRRDVPALANFTFPDWKRIAEEYDGIETTEFCWSPNPAMSWYDLWECASGCIWRPKGVRLV